MKYLLIGLSFLFLFGTPVLAGTYTVDADHSEIGFAVKHMVITNVKGAFRQHNSKFEVDKDNKLLSVQAEVTVDSIDTRVQKRDDHLRSPEFFDAAKYPAITFNSTSIKSVDGNSYIVTGILKIKDVAREITLDGELSGPVKDPWGNQRMGIILKGQIDRNDFGVTYNKVLETGGLLIDNTVAIHLEGEGILN